MQIVIREYRPADLPQMTAVWNYVVEKGDAFPQITPFCENDAAQFFKGQSFTGVAQLEDEIAGLYILHPNNVGRCGHLSNASYAVRPDYRGLHIGELLVRHSLEKAKELGFRILQYNAVVKSNTAAIHLYQKLNFVELGVVPGGFLRKDGTYEDILLYYHAL